MVGDLLRGGGGMRIWVVEIMQYGKWQVYAHTPTACNRASGRIDLEVARTIHPRDTFRLRPYRREGK